MSNESDHVIEPIPTGDTTESSEPPVAPAPRRRRTRKPPVTPPAPKHWAIGTWGDRTRYACRYCAFATLREADIRQHVEGHLMAQRPTSNVGLVDQHGKPLPRRE